MGAQLVQPGPGHRPHPIQRQVASEVAASTSSALRRIEAAATLASSVEVAAAQVTSTLGKHVILHGGRCYGSLRETEGRLGAAPARLR